MDEDEFEKLAREYHGIVVKRARPRVLDTRDVESMDKAIDGLVYELYGLTEEEIKIAEGI